MIAIMSTEEPGAHIIDREGTLIAFVAFSHVPNDLAWTPDQQGLTYAPAASDVAGVLRRSPWTARRPSLQRHPIAQPTSLGIHRMAVGSHSRMVGGG